MLIKFLGLLLFCNFVSSRSINHELSVVSQSFNDSKTNTNFGTFELTGSVPMRKVNNKDYSIKVSVGTPPQKFEVLFDITGHSFFLIDKSCNSDPCNVSKVGEKVHNRRKYDFNASTTAKMTNKTMQAVLLRGKYVNDVLTVGGLNLQNRPIASVKKMHELFSNMLADGELWLGSHPEYYLNYTTGSKTSALSNFTIALNPVSTSTIENAGSVTFNSVDSRICSGNKTYVPVYRESISWNILHEGFIYDSLNVNTSSTLDLDFKSHTTYITDDLYFEIVKKTSAEWNSDESFHLVDCKKVDSFPSIIIKFKNGHITLDGKHYTKEVQPGTCVFTFSELFFPPNIILGQPFFQQYCVTYDVQNNQVGLSKQISKN